MNVKEIVVLEALRKTGTTVPLPIEGIWTSLKDVLKILFKEGLLEIHSGEFVISPDGKKACLLFNDTRKELIEPFEQYKKLYINGNEIDARLPIAAFSIRKKRLPEDIALDYLENLNVFFIWEGFFDYVKARAKTDTVWQTTLLDTFKLQANYNVQTDIWKRLGADENSAIITGTKATMPEDLVQIKI